MVEVEIVSVANDSDSISLQRSAASGDFSGVDDGSNTVRVRTINVADGKGVISIRGRQNGDIALAPANKDPTCAIPTCGTNIVTCPPVFEDV